MVAGWEALTCGAGGAEIAGAVFALVLAVKGKEILNAGGLVGKLPGAAALVM